MARNHSQSQLLGDDHLHRPVDGSGSVTASQVDRPICLSGRILLPIHKEKPAPNRDVAPGRSDDDRWLLPAEAAELGGWTKREMRDHVFAGRLPYRSGRSARYRVSEVLAAKAAVAEMNDRSAPIRAVRDNATRVTYDVVTELPPVGSGYLYLLEIHGLGVKVGISVDPESRIADHTLAAWQWARQLGRLWLSEHHPAWKRNEQLVKRSLLPRGHSTEYLPTTFEDALRAATALETQ